MSGLECGVDSKAGKKKISKRSAVNTVKLKHSEIETQEKDDGYITNITDLLASNVKMCNNL